MAIFKGLWASLFLALLFSGCILTVVRAQDEGVEDDDEPDPEPVAPIIPKPAPGVETVYVFPNNPEKLAPAGEPVEILCGFENNGNVDLKVVGIKATLNHPLDYSVAIQNFTGKEYDAVVAPGEHHTFHYSFTVFKNMIARDFGLAASVYYTSKDGSQFYSSTFYNGTVDVVEPSSLLSGETFFLVALGLGLSALLGSWLYGQFEKRVLKRKGRKAKVETGTRTTVDAGSNEWLKGTAADPKYGASVSTIKKRVA